LDIGYLSYTGIGDRNLDGVDHRWQIDFFAKQGRLPRMGMCVTCGHAPLYYVLGGLVMKLFTALHVTSVDVALQSLSLGFFLGFVAFAVATTRLFIASPLVVRLVAALTAFWPSSVLNSVRVHNDSLASLCMAGALYFTARYDQRERPRDLYWAAVWSGLAILTKSSGYTIVVVLLVVLGFQAKRLAKGGPKPAVIAVSTLLAAIVIVGKARVMTITRTPTVCERLLGRACNAAQESYVGNKPINYLYFDLRYFLTEPFLPNPLAGERRDYFWNAVAKTSLFGRVPLGQPFGGRFDAALGIVLSALFLGLLTYTVVGALDATFEQVHRHRVLLLAGGSMLSLLTCFRVLVPIIWHEDVRHVFALLIPALVLFGKVVERYRRTRRALYWAGWGLALLFILASVLLFRPRLGGLRAGINGMARASAIQARSSAPATLSPQGSRVCGPIVRRGNARPRIAAEPGAPARHEQSYAQSATPLRSSRRAPGAA
jgi:hypothetical protein